MLQGLSQISIELSAVCDKHTFCPFCGRQDEAINPQQKGQIDLNLLASIQQQIRGKVAVVQFHRDGEPTAYKDLATALWLFEGFVTSIVTHGENLVKKAGDIIGHCTSLTVSLFKGDKDADLQFAAVKEFLEIKGDRPPMVNVKVVGAPLEAERETEYEHLGVPIIRRLMHVPGGNYRYARRDPVIPEHNICLDFLHHPSVDWRGRLFICNRISPHDEGMLGDLNVFPFEMLWNSPKRMKWLEAHKRGRRDQASPLCKDCLYYGVPSE